MLIIRVVREERMAQWKERQHKFKEDWAEIKTQKRVIVHIPSLSVDKRIV